MEELTPTASQTLPKNRRGGNIPNSFYAVSIILTAKPDKDTTRKLQSSIPCKPRYKILHKISSNHIQKHITRIIHHGQVGFVSGKKARVVQHSKINLYHIDRMKEKL